MISLADGLSAQGDSVRVFTLYPGGDLAPVVENHGRIGLTSLGKRSRWDLVRPVVRLYRALIADVPDILYTCMPVENLFGAAIRPFVPPLRLVWGIQVVPIDAGRLRPFLYWLLRALCSVPDLIVSNSRAGRDAALAAGMPSARVVVVPNGFDTLRFRPDAEARKRVREEIGITRDDIVIGHVARLDPMKDQTMLLRAMSLLLKQRPNARLVMVGAAAGPHASYASRLREEAATLGISGRVSWLGARPDVESLYPAFDILALTSRSEGSPNVLGEAMACGVPCVATDIADCSWTIGDTGLTTPAGDADAFARALESAIGANLAELGPRARDRIVSTFGVSVLVAATRKLLLSLLSED